MPRRPDETADREGSQLGGEIRRIRQLQGTTLVQLAERTGLTASFLSQLERGLTGPSMSSLERIAQALGTTQLALMAATVVRVSNGPSDDPTLLLRQDEGPVVPHGSGGGQGRLLLAGEQRPFQTVEFVLDGSGAAAGDGFVHDEGEFVYVAEGHVIVELASDDGWVAHELGPGDALYYGAGTRHRWHAARHPDGAPHARFLVVKPRPGG